MRLVFWRNRPDPREILGASFAGGQFKAALLSLIGRLYRILDCPQQINAVHCTIAVLFCEDIGRIDSKCREREGALLTISISSENKFEYS